MADRTPRSEVPASAAAPPMTAPVLAIFTELICEGRIVTISAAHIGSATSPRPLLAPGKSRVRYVLPGPESNEFVFCDNAVYYIAISATNPLKPGSVGFQLITSNGSATNLRPKPVGEVILYANSARTGINAIVAIGAYGSTQIKIDPAALDNIRAAIASALQGRADAFIAVKMAVALQGFWRLRGYATEGRAVVKAALALPQVVVDLPAGPAEVHLGGAGVGLLLVGNGDQDDAAPGGVEDDGVLVGGRAALVGVGRQRSG